MYTKALMMCALQRWGIKTQYVKTAEECAELIKECMKAMEGAENLPKLAEEIADVEIMCMQMRVVLGANESMIDAFIFKKLSRLEQIIAAEEERENKKKEG